MRADRFIIIIIILWVGLSVLWGTQIPSYQRIPLLNGPMAGITILHNGSPVKNLQVMANDQGIDNHFFVGTTDGSGTFSYPTGALWIPGGVDYTFTINATNYSALGTNHDIRTVEI
jgi:hypothetical protein